MNNNNNTTDKKTFVDSFNSVQDNLRVRYSINMHLDFIQEFIKFADNTRNLSLQCDIRDRIEQLERDILGLINIYENENRNKENID